jgi:hypothetical protein
MRWIDGGVFVEKSMQCFRGETLVRGKQISGYDSRKCPPEKVPFNSYHALEIYYKRL